MDHIYQLCRDHSPLVYLIVTLLVLAGVGIGMLAKTLIPAIIKIFKKQVVEINVGNPEKPSANNSGNEAKVQPHGYCEICPEHPNFIKFVDTIKEQQTKNMETIISMRITQESNLVIITEITRQQSKMWEKLDRIPDEFGTIKGQLGEIKGMISQHIRSQQAKL